MNMPDIWIVFVSLFDIDMISNYPTFKDFLADTMNGFSDVDRKTIRAYLVYLESEMNVKVHEVAWSQAESNIQLSFNDELSMKEFYRETISVIDDY